MAELESFSLSDRGRRQNNEDFAAFYEPPDPVERAEKGCLYVVADGVGGAARGERASQFAAQKVLYEYYQQSVGVDPSERLRQIIQKVNEDIHSYAELKGIRMATTIVAIVIRKGIIHVANVGDSRAYLIRGDQCKQLNRDHSIVGEMVASGEMTEAAAMASKVKNRLTRSLGGEPDVHVDVYPSMELNPGDKVLLCTDGLTRYATREDVYRLAAQGSLPEIGRALVQFANERGGADNVSVVLVSFEGAEIIVPASPLPQPADVELDAMPTQPGIPVISRSRRWSQSSLVALSALAVLVLSFAGFTIAKNWGPRKAVVVGSALPQASPSPKPAFPVVLPSDTPTLSATPAPSSTVGGTVTASVLLESSVCVRQVKIDPQLATLSGVIVETGGKYVFGQKYYECELDGTRKSCQNLTEITNNGIVRVDQWIVVPDINQFTCVSKGGLWVLSPPAR